MTNQSAKELLGAITNLANMIANEDDTVVGAESLRNYHYSNAIDLIRHHLDPNYDIRWLEKAYEYWKPKIEEML